MELSSAYDVIVGQILSWSFASRIYEEKKKIIIITARMRLLTLTEITSHWTNHLEKSLPECGSSFFMRGVENMTSFSSINMLQVLVFQNYC